jgi:tetratricopeptide (TPR) repeat protein
MRGAVLAFALSAGVVAGIARADTPPSGWDAVRDPGAARRFALHHRVQEILASNVAGPRQPLLVRARALLEQAHAESSSDVRLRFDLGEIYATLENNIGAIEVLAPALEGAPDDPGAAQALLSLANAYAKLDRSDEERRVYERFLPRVTNDRTRATAMLNLSEADMHLGDLESAIAGYRATKDLAGQLPNQIELQDHTGALAVWGLAVALDRAGDIPGGASEAKLAIALDHDMATMRLNPNVFFSPERERDWYVALGFTEYAKEEEDARKAAAWWDRAEGCWREYIEDAVTHGAQDRWVNIARARMGKARAQRLAVERRVKGKVAYPQYECVR